MKAGIITVELRAVDRVTVPMQTAWWSTLWLAVRANRSPLPIAQSRLDEAKRAGANPDRLPAT